MFGTPQSAREFTVLPLDPLGVGQVGDPSQRKIHNIDCVGIELYINFISAQNAATLTVYIEGIDPASGLPFLLLSLAVSTAGLKLMRVHPALTTGAGVANLPLPERLNVRIVQSTQTDAILYSVGGCLTR